MKKSVKVKVFYFSVSVMSSYFRYSEKKINFDDL